MSTENAKDLLDVRLNHLKFGLHAGVGLLEAMDGLLEELMGDEFPVEFPVGFFEFTGIFFRRRGPGFEGGDF